MRGTEDRAELERLTLTTWSKKMDQQRAGWDRALTVGMASLRISPHAGGKLEATSLVAVFETMTRETTGGCSYRHDDDMVATAMVDGTVSMSLVYLRQSF